MKNNWTLEWYLENQFSKEVKKAFREDTEGKGQRSIYEALLELRFKK